MGKTTRTPPGAIGRKRMLHPAAWVPTAYVAEGIPFAMVIWVAGTMFKDLGHSDSEITVAVASIGIAWSLKPLWAGFLDMFKTKKFFVLAMEFFIAALLCAMAFALHLDSYFIAILAVMWVIAFASATQDICVDGIYITALSKKQQAAFIGVQGMAWNVGRIIAVSLVVWVAGYLQDDVGLETKISWTVVLALTAILMSSFGLYHLRFLPTGSLPSEQHGKNARQIVADFLTSAADFCTKRSLWGMLAFVFFYRSAEGLLLVEAPLFIQGCLEDGGLQLSLRDKGVIDGTISTVVSIAGGLLGGVFIARFTLKRTLFLLALCVNVPNACYVYLAHAVSPDNPVSFAEIAFVVSLEKFWYGFGFVGNMLYMMQQLAPGRFKMTHYAFATALMNLVLVPTQMASGPLADLLGFKQFFWLVMVATAPSLLAAWFAPFPRLGASYDERATDDDSPLDRDDREVQRAAGRATIFALLAIVLFLYVDVLSLGWMSHTTSGLLLVSLLMIVAGTTTLKIFLAVKAIVAGRVALAIARRLRAGKAYAGNATGAIVAAAAVLVISSILSVYWVEKIKSTDWQCAFSRRAPECLQPEAVQPRQCQRESIER